MNCLNGTISNIRGEQSLSIVSIDVNGIKMSSVVIESPDSARLQPGQEVQVLFKETEVVLGLPGNHQISLQNRIPCIVEEIDSGGLLARVKMRHNGLIVESIVTDRAIEQLGIKSGSEVIAMIKTNEVLLQT